MIVAPVVLTAVMACAGGAALAVRMRDADLPSAQRMGIGRCRRQRDGPDRRFRVGERIYARSQDGRLEPLEEQGFATEDDLQALIADHPDLLDGKQIQPDNPRRWILVTREKGIAESPGASHRWAVDHLVVDQDAVPTLVEVKRASNPGGRWRWPWRRRRPSRRWRGAGARASRPPTAGGASPAACGWTRGEVPHGARARDRAAEDAGG